MQQRVPEKIIKGNSTTIQRYSNVTTGYKWDILVSPGLTVTRNEYLQSENVNRGIVGSGGIQSWTIKAIGEGRQYILLWQHRPWENDNLEGSEIMHLDIVDNSPLTPIYQPIIPNSYPMNGQQLSPQNFNQGYPSYKQNMTGSVNNYYHNPY